MQSVNEGTSATLTMAFTDEDGSSITPSSATYTLFDKFSGEIVRSGAISPLSESVDFQITPSDTAIMNSRNRYEIRTVEVTFLYDGKTGKGEYSFKAVNLAKSP